MTGAESFAFTAGVLAALNPCGVAMLPSYLAFFVANEGVGPAERDALSRLVRGLVVSIMVSCGVAVTFVSAGVVIGAGFSLLGRVLPVVGVGLGAGLIGLGLAVLAGVHVSGLRLAATARRQTGVAAMAWFGVAYGLASLSCSLPVFLIVVGASTAGGSSGGATAFAAFALGMSAVITIATVGAALFTHLLAAIERARRHIPVVSGLLLLGAGVYVINRDLPLAVVAAGHHAPSTGSVAAATAILTLATVATVGVPILARRRSSRVRFF